jgi:hypothetical protein
VDEHDFLTTHCAHEPSALIARWRDVASAAGLSISVFAESDDHELFVLRSEAPPTDAPRVYLSTGVHGDEPGAALGLLHWAEVNVGTLRELDVLIFPLHNPVGLQDNTRLDGTGRDLNRMFHSDEPPFPEWRREVGEERFDLSICLHEDYDGRGCYIYELGLGGLAERLLEAGAEFIPPDSRSQIDISEAVNGVVRHGDLQRDELPLEGLPEAIWLYFERCPVSLTLETPSEFSLWSRIHAHAAMISEGIRSVAKTA